MNNNFAGKLTTIAFCTLFAGTSLAVAADAEEDYICEAKQNSRNELALLAESCPVGKGLWGRKPQQDSGFFWIQCGIFPEPLSLTKAKRIYEMISTDVWLHPEGKGYRCLAGPYDSYDKARSESQKIRTLPAYKEAFVRWVVKDAQPEQAASAKKPTSQPRPSVTATTAAEPPSKSVRKLSPQINRLTLPQSRCRVSQHLQALRSAVKRRSAENCMSSPFWRKGTNSSTWSMVLPGTV